MLLVLLVVIVVYLHLQTSIRSKPLKVMVFHSAVAAHQTCAVLCLSLLKELSEKLGGLEGRGGELMRLC